MAEKEVYERTIEHLCGEIDMLRSMLIRIASELPERAMYHISQEAARLRKEADADATARPNDRRRDYANGAWDTAATIEEVMEVRIDEAESGAWVRTVQPARIPKEDQAFPEKGW